MLAVVGKGLGRLSAHNCAHLPRAWGTLYYLARLDRRRLLRLIAQGKIHPALSVKEAFELSSQQRLRSNQRLTGTEPEMPLQENSRCPTGHCRKADGNMPVTLPSSELGDPLVALSRREWEVLTLINQGLDDKTIAGRMGLSINTIKFFKRNLFAKCNAHSRSQVILRSLAARVASRP